MGRQKRQDTVFRPNDRYEDALDIAEADEPPPFIDFAAQARQGPVYLMDRFLVLVQ